MLGLLVTSQVTGLPVRVCVCVTKPTRVWGHRVYGQTQCYFGGGCLLGIPGPTLSNHV